VKKTIKVAITGKIGTGKTTICRFLKKEGFNVFESDKEVRKLLYKKKIIAQVSNLFSDKVKFLLNDKGKVNRKALGDFLFSNKKELEKLEKILYPYLEIQKKKFEKQYSSSKVIFFDIPLLFEKKVHKAFDRIILLKVNNEIQKKRVLKRNGIDENKLKKILLNQKYNINLFKKFVSLEIDTSKNKILVNKEIKKFTQNL